MTKPRFEALSRICLNNWHYIKHKTLSLNEGVNFFTGHSGSGKSTVIDAMQIVLYANTDGRGFFNKAAADDSDRNLIEYLRGMINIGENNEFAYLRNQNFSSTIVLELRQTDTGECQCVGVVFDVETATNEITRMFFWHKGPMPEHQYRTSARALSTEEVKDYLLRNFTKEQCYYGSHNERFRKQLYDIYLGGLDSEKFPLLFKRAIPFRMNIKLEEFVKEYICMEQDIHIDDMQQSVMMYGRMRKKIEDTCLEIQNLTELGKQFALVQEAQKDIDTDAYYVEKLEILQCRAKAQAIQDKIALAEEELLKQQKRKEKLNLEVKELTTQSDELWKRIAASGYEELKERLSSLNELVERLGSSKARWEQTSIHLNQWVEQDITSNRMIWDIEAFAGKTIVQEALIRLQKEIAQMHKEVLKQQQEANAVLREIGRREAQAQEELTKLKAGNKAYPKELEQARTILQTRLYQETGKSVTVEILADLIEIRDDQWRNAIEGYLGSNKLTLIVEPRYVRTAMQIYQELDREKYFRVAVLDTEKVMLNHHAVLQGALSEEVSAQRQDIEAYINFLLGKVIKCDNIDELRECKIGITKDCVLYHSYRMQYINPDYYTKLAYIGKNSIRRRIKLLEQTLQAMEVERQPQQEIVKESETILQLEKLGQPPEVYLEWQKDLEDLGKKQSEQRHLREKLELLKAKDIDSWEAQRQALLEMCTARKNVCDETQRQIYIQNDVLERSRDEAVKCSEELLEKEGIFTQNVELEASLTALLTACTNPRYDLIGNEYREKLRRAGEIKDQERQKLIEDRFSYLRLYPNRNYSPTSEDNEAYAELLSNLSCDRLEEYKKSAAEQAKSAVEHFKDDFMFKIRSAIREALQRKDELNRIISRLDFGKDKYQFYIGKNKGDDGRYYDMFMDEALEVNPSQLDVGIEHQMNFFTIEHEEHYGQLINDLIGIFIPPDNATAEDLETAKRNMDKYADYRTYLSFDMQQLIQNEDEIIKIRLSKMIKKNSGGEGQNPLYVALLASFAQAYRINLSPKIKRPPTIRLVVLDEAFSKMDSEKVASCIQLIRGLGFQALISATNDKIQNYLETVDKIFVFANPNKKCISIQEFEKEDFGQLARNLEDEDDIVGEDSSAL